MSWALKAWSRPISVSSQTLVKAKMFPVSVPQMLKEGRLCWKSRAGKPKVSSSGPGVDQNIAFHALPNCHYLIFSHFWLPRSFSWIFCLSSGLYPECWILRTRKCEPRAAKDSLFKSLWNRSEYSHACFAYCQEFLPLSFFLQVLFSTILVYSTSLFCAKPAPYVLPALVLVNV